MHFTKHTEYGGRLFFFGKRETNEPVSVTRFTRTLLLSILFITLVFSLAAQDEVLVGGTITQDEEWTKDYLYIVYQDLRIPDSVTLTIQEGVTVKINQGRGIFVLAGNLLVNGQKNDSVRFLANYTRDEKDWKWKGISYTGSVGGNVFSYGHVLDAEIAIDIYNSEAIEIRNSCFINSQMIGVRLFNSRNCLVDSCLFKDNYDGIEMVATNNEEASGNLIRHSIFKNSNHNLYLLKAYGGILINNLIENNLIEGGNNGIWLDNGGGEAFGRNTIQKNIFMYNGAGAGYSLMMGQDSFDVKYNIFWNNYLAIYHEQGTKGALIANNSFCQNDRGVLLSVESTGNQWRNNTFSAIKSTVLTIAEIQGTVFSHNNLFAYPGQEKIISNNTPDNLSVSENYWHTDQDSVIRKLIWDKQDDPALGELFFTPFLTAADTTNPVSPPMRLIKQQVDGEVRVSWTANPENDLRSYKVYFGIFENYSFPFSEDVGNDTVYFLQNVAVSDTIAVTALDSAIAGSDAQLAGHESPFAFARIYPYAGPDGEICRMHTEFDLNNSTVPFVYDNLLWTTGGDGTFSDAQAIRPVYYPGPGDRENGQVVLTLSVLSGQDLKKDSLMLYIYDDPVVFAGNDTTLFADEQLTLDKAYALYYKSVHWTTTGDGTFDNDTLMHPVFTPGSHDISSGETALILMAESECGSTYDTLHLLLQPFFSVEGNVWHNRKPVAGGVVLAVKDNPEGARAVELAYAEADGYFVFNKLAEGKYYLYAIPDTLNNDGAVPGYYADKLRWQQAWYFSVAANTYDVDIMLPSADYLLPEGEGSVSGYFTMPDAHLFAGSIFCNSWFEPGSTLDYCDDGLSNITVFLYNTNGTKLLDYTLTDENGNFYFRHLPYGGYIIDAEKTGYETTVSPLITLSPEHKHETGVVLELTGNKIGIYRNSGTSGKALAEVYPNPVKHFLYVPVEDINGTADINIYNSFGQLVLHKKMVPGNGIWQSQIKLDVSKLNAGIYIGRIVDPGTSTNFTFIKN